MRGHPHRPKSMVVLCSGEAFNLIIHHGQSRELSLSTYLSEMSIYIWFPHTRDTFPLRCHQLDLFPIERREGLIKPQFRYMVTTFQRLTYVFVFTDNVVGTGLFSWLYIRHGFRCATTHWLFGKWSASLWKFETGAELCIFTMVYHRYPISHTAGYLLRRDRDRISSVEISSIFEVLSRKGVCKVAYLCAFKS